MGMESVCRCTDAVAAVPSLSRLLAALLVAVAALPQAVLAVYQITKDDLDYGFYYEILRPDQMPQYRPAYHFYSHHYTHVFSSNIRKDPFNKVLLYYDYDDGFVRWDFSPAEYLLWDGNRQKEYTITILEDGRQVCFERPLLFDIQRPRAATHAYMLVDDVTGNPLVQTFRTFRTTCRRQEYGAGMMFQRTEGSIRTDNWPLQAPGLRASLVEELADICMHPRYMRVDWRNQTYEFTRMRPYSSSSSNNNNNNFWPIPSGLFNLPDNSLVFPGQTHPGTCLPWSFLTQSPMRQRRMAFIKEMYLVLKVVFEGIIYARQEEFRLAGFQ